MTAKPLQRQKCEIYTRVVGYLSPTSRWNGGKKAEYADRKNYSLNHFIKEEGEA